MKRILVAVLSMLLLVVSGCGGTSEQTEQAAPVKAQAADSKAEHSSADTGKSIVVYFSATGHTKQLAESAAKALGADLQEIRPEQPYTEHDLDYNDKTTRATVEQNDPSSRPAIAGKIAGVEQAATVVVAYPIWWGQEPRIMDTFAESYDLKGKNLVAICTSGGSDIGQSGEAIAALAKGAAYKGGKLFSPSASEQELQTWFREIGVLGEARGK